MLRFKRGAPLCGALCGLLLAFGGGASASAAPCYSSTPNSASYADPYGDGDAGLAPDIVSGSLTVDGACNFSLSYTIADQSQMLSGDFISWFIDVDNDLATGSQTGFRGADFAVGRLGTGSSALSRYNPSTGQFDTVKPETPAGAFGVQTNLADFESTTAPTFAIAGGSSWKSSSTGASYFDFAPDAGLGTVPFAVQFSDAAPPPPPPPPPPPTPSPPPAPPNAGTQGTQTGSAAVCKVPLLKGLKLAQARTRLRQANCRLGRVRYRRSTKLVGRVVRTAPGTGQKLAAGASVDVVVARRKKRGARAAAAWAATSEIELVTRKINAVVKGR